MNYYEIVSTTAPAVPCLFLRQRLDLDAQRHLRLEAPLRRVVQPEFVPLQGAEEVRAAPLALEERMRDALEHGDLQRDRPGHPVHAELPAHRGRRSAGEALELPLVAQRREFLRVQLLRSGHVFVQLGVAEVDTRRI